jgi:hypothetical protein
VPRHADPPPGRPRVWGRVAQRPSCTFPVMAVSQQDVDAWADDAGRMRYQIHNFDAGDERAAREAIANFLSEHGYEAAVAEMFGEPLETGYLLALRAVRDGEFDGELEECGRPDTGD